MLIDGLIARITTTGTATFIVLPPSSRSSRSLKPNDMKLLVDGEDAGDFNLTVERIRIGSEKGLLVEVQLEAGKPSSPNEGEGEKNDWEVELVGLSA